MLTQREEEVAELLTDGHENVSIASILNVSPHTVKFHVNNLVRKLGARNRTHAAILYFKRKMNL